MPYDTYVWGEAQAASGYTATAAISALPIQKSGDTITVRKGLGTPYIVGGGATSDTKCGGCKLVPSRSMSGEGIILPGMSTGDFFVRDAMFQLQEGETLTGYVDNANTNEGSLIACDVAYGGTHRYPQTVGEAAAAAGGGTLYSVPFSITSAAAVTSDSGAAVLETVTTEDRWLDTTANYHILGVIPSVGAATFGGIMQVTALGGDWNGSAPGITVPALSAVTFDSRATFVPAYEPIPFSGDATPTAGMAATSAGAIVGGLVILKH